MNRRTSTPCGAPGRDPRHALDRSSVPRVHDFRRLEIYNASPNLPVPFPAWTGWRLAGRCAGLAPERDVAAVRRRHRLSGYGFASGHFRRDLKPPRPAELGRPGRRAALSPCSTAWVTTTRCSALLYAGVIIAIIQQIMTGLAISKPVQFGWLAGLFGGYPTPAASTLRHHVRHRRLRSRRCTPRGDPPAHAEVDDRYCSRKIEESR